MKTVIILFTIFAVALCNEQRISRKKCEEYNIKSQEEHRCRVEDKGIESYYSFVAALGYKEEDGFFRRHCSAVLISPRYILTDVHCVINFTGNNNLYVRLRTETIKVVEINVKNEYKSLEEYSDLAILKLEISTNVTPACLYAGEHLELYGVAAHYYSYSYYDGRYEYLFRFDGAVPRAENSACRKKYQRFSQGIEFDQYFCTNITGKFCESSVITGSPIFNKDSDLQCMHTVAGLWAYGDNPCEEQLNLNIRLSPFIDWIESVVWKK